MSRLGLRLHADEEHWIPLSDLMTGLMFLFLLIALAYMVAVQSQHASSANVIKTFAQQRAGLSRALDQEFANDLRAWNAVFDPDTLSIRFSSKDVQFQKGGAELQPRFKAILADFFPRYVRVLTQPQFKDLISEVRIEGYTSTEWTPGATLDQAYLGNMALSQDRTRSVLSYVLELPAVAPQKPWLMQTLTANGLSFSHLIRTANGTEDVNASQRVEFHVRTNSEEELRKLMALSGAPRPAATQAAPAAQTAVEVLDEPRPPFPAWVKSSIGKRLQALYPKTTLQCLGYLGGMDVRYSGSPGGSEMTGWAYDTVAKVAAARVVLTDTNGVVIGGADGGFPRPDVPAAIPQVTSTTTGWEGYANPAPSVAAWAIVGTPPAACRLEFADAHSSKGN